ncbi:unnamed protein product [Cochlearia groenlandica]
MVFSSHQVNDQFDSNNWQQENQHYLEIATINQNPNFNIPQFSSQPAASEAGSSQARVVNSMVERARIAKVPLPEASLKCPRCDSTNTKFCYFNNYNLTQPRHFCKACRRYWTRGGALRNVPVGGGFRRNKRSKSNGNGRSKSTDNNNNNNNNTSSSLACEPSYLNPSKFLGYGQTHGFASNLPTLPPIQSLGGYNSNNIGLDFGAMMSSNGGILDQWRLSSMQQAPQFPFLINTPSLGQSSNVSYPLPQDNQSVSQANPQESSDYTNHIRSKPLMDMATQTRNVKEEESDQDHRDGNGLNSLSRNFMGDINNEYTPWGGNSNINSTTSWTGFASNNSTSHLTF